MPETHPLVIIHLTNQEAFQTGNKKSKHVLRRLNPLQIRERFRRMAERGVNVGDVLIPYKSGSVSDFMSKTALETIKGLNPLQIRERFRLLPLVTSVITPS